MPVLTLYSEYSRQDVHDIFSSETRFTPSSGTWGLHGIVKIPKQPGDFVFFVTYGRQQANHLFDEWITEDGVISWQSQPGQSIQDGTIQQFISHDEKKNSIFLFLRTNRAANYMFLGKLKFLKYDPVREKPVYMYWQLLDWPIPQDALNHLGLTLRPIEIEHSFFPEVNDSFTWRGRIWKINANHLRNEVRGWIKRGLPDEASRYTYWYIDIDGHRVSPKWLFHLITGADYGEFDSPQAREKLKKVGFISKYSQEKNGEKVIRESSMGAYFRPKPEDRREFFQKIARIATEEAPGIFTNAHFTFYKRENYFDLHFPHLRGFFSFRLARNVDIYGFFFPTDRSNTETIVEKISTCLPEVSQKVGFPITVIPTYWDGWGRFGFEVHIDMPIVGLDKAEIESVHAQRIIKFFSASLNILPEYFPRKNKPAQKIIKPEISEQSKILESKIVEIRDVLAGKVITPANEVLCDWLHFCYEFKLYNEGHYLSMLLTSDNVNPWYYERTKKLARLCSMRTTVKD